MGTPHLARAADPGSAGTSPWSARARRGLFPYLLVAPVVLLVSLGVVYPVVYLIYLSLQDYSAFYARIPRFVGLQNYAQLLGDPEFWHSLVAGAIWVAGSVVPQFVLGLAMALLLNERFPGRGVVRTLILLPWVVSGVVAGVVWIWLFDGTVGVINDLLMKVGLIRSPVAWGISQAGTWFTLFLANAWRGAPFFGIVLLAALQSISPDLYEAAKIDGAGRSQRFRFVTLPLIMNTVIVATLLRSLWTFNFIDLILTMTRGGPVNTTRTLPLYIFDTTYLSGNFGYAAALATALGAILLVFAGVYWQLHRLGHDE